jgi:Uma2 family endonuclease
VSVLIPLIPPGFRAAAVPDDFIWRLSVDQYHQMIRAGILTDEDPVELLEGWLVVKMPKNSPHRAATRLTSQALERLVPAGWYVGSQDPVTFLDSEPEPDLVVVRGDRRQYADHHPSPQDLALIGEVADTTLQRDRTSKKRLYAEAGIPIYWIVNLSEKQFEICSEPSGPADQPDYRRRQDYGAADTVPVVVDGREIGRVAVADLLP